MCDVFVVYFYKCVNVGKKKMKFKIELVLVKFNKFKENEIEKFDVVLLFVV